MYALLAITACPVLVHQHNVLKDRSGQRLPESHSGRAACAPVARIAGKTRWSVHPARAAKVISALSMRAQRCRPTRPPVMPARKGSIAQAVQQIRSSVQQERLRHQEGKLRVPRVQKAFTATG